MISTLVEGLGTHKVFSQKSLIILKCMPENRRKKRETPVLVYNSLKLYGTVRSKGIIDNIFHLGLCVSYDQVLGLKKEFADSSVKGYNINGVFCPNLEN